MRYFFIFKKNEKLICLIICIIAISLCVHEKKKRNQNDLLVFNTGVFKLEKSGNVRHTCVDKEEYT